MTRASWSKLTADKTPSRTGAVIRKRPARGEANDCQCLTRWRDHAKCTLPDLKWLSHIPNGGKRHPAIAAQLKAEGANAGVWDYDLPVRRGPYVGLWVEMKLDGRQGERNGGLSAAQVEFGEFQRRQGRKTVVCYGWNEAVEAIKDYLNLAIDVNSIGPSETVK